MKSRRNILQYSKRQEERLIRKLENLGVKVRKHYGDREKNSGDVLCDIMLGGKFIRYRIDHKSTQSPETFTLKEDELRKLTLYCARLMDRDGYAHAAVSIGWYDKEEMAVVSYKPLGPPSGHAWRVKERGKHMQIKFLSLENIKGGYGALHFHDFTAYIYRLPEWVYYNKVEL